MLAADLSDRIIKYRNILQLSFMVELSYDLKHIGVWMDDLRFRSFSIVFQSYPGDGRVIIKVCVQWKPIYDSKDPRLTRGSNPGPLDKQASA